MERKSRFDARRLLVPALLLFAYVSVGFRPSDATKIAFIDMSKLVSQHKQSQAEQTLIQQWHDAMRKLLEADDKNLSALRGTLETFKTGSEEWKRQQQEIKLEEFKLTQKAKGLDEEFDAKVARSLIDAHARVAAACKTYLEGHDLDLILQFTSGPVSGNTRNEVIPEIVVRSVVSHRAALDVTDAILGILDTK
ncbi:MAG TPA: OmpH family outer membrane protein [Planctomycetota bacterium]|jgi:Skp family chaperone for outer membrane proteins|nr:OmpH family outer membrane protein [Planctomycetota bacterium]